MWRLLLVSAALVSVVAACDDEDRPPVDAPGTAPITACADIDAAGLTSDTIDGLVAAYNGRACQGPLAGGTSGSLQECHYGEYLFVCGQSAGLWQFGCTCGGDQLSCSNGERIKAGQEALCADGGVDAP